MLEHFLQEGMFAGLRPNPFFEPLWYYRQLEGAHDIQSGLRHFVLEGDSQARAASLEFDGSRYLERYPEVASAQIPPLYHYLLYGIDEGRSRFPVPDPLKRLRALTHLEGGNGADAIDAGSSLETYNTLRERVESRRQVEKDSVLVKPVALARVSGPAADLAYLLPALALPKHERPKVSILIPTYNEIDYTVDCIASILKSEPRASYEVVIADDCSPDPSAAALSQIANIIFIRQEKNLGFLRNCNAAFAHCQGTYLLLLNNDAELMPGALDVLVDALDRTSDVAAVGPKILYPNGRLQEAGCIINRDASTQMVGLFADPKKPRFSYDRDIDYCSGAALLVRRSEIGDVLFDERFAPAYCEDTDLCLRLLSKGRRIRYCHKAEVAHHLSVSTNKQSVAKRLQLVALNQQKLLEKWSQLLEEMNSARVIAFYLPQFHPTPENDYYWGKGFTEWTNASKARPAYNGHYQPHLPADLGFYDLRIKQTFRDQAAMAQRYGIAGFCVYYYNFAGRRALDQAFEAVVADREINFPYCVCWANENWTRHWDGGDKELIFEQSYDERTLLNVVADAIRYSSDTRYIRVNSRPLFMVYRPLLIPDVNGFTDICREKFIEAGFEGVHLVYVESMEASLSRPAPSDIGFDACVEFPPQGLAVQLADQKQDIIQENFIGIRYDYESTAVESICRSSVPYKRYPSAFPSWDNTPRQPVRGDSFVGASPEAFQVYVEEKLREATEQFVGEERLVFINAWNEWAEGTHLEPDRKFGHRWLESIRNALLSRSQL
jgi:GT2 family glycosyltransferase